MYGFSKMKQIIFKKYDSHKKYFACHVRHQAIVHFLENLEEDEYKEWIIKQVKDVYGSGEEGGVGPFSIKSYLEYMVKDGSWGDNIMLGLVASMWGVHISVLLGESCGEVRIRHNLEWPEVDFGLLFNCNMVTGHYSGVKRIHHFGVECKKINERHNYSRNIQ